jgi:asparagine synthase (glutamine-hydrolysing)
MCGVCGFIDFKLSTGNDVLNKMISSIGHRGPDDSGSEIRLSDNALVGLGHTRLSILDLSPGGHQPMNYYHLSIVYNGEVYNFKEIKDELLNLGHLFISDSDTEVILHSFLEWGNICVSKFIGMFVIVIFNNKTLELTIIRDRAGVKPIFYYWENDLFLFASELKAFHEHPRFIKKINENAVHQFMDFGYIPSPYCVFVNCHKLDPGHFLTFKIADKKLELTKYWDVNDYYRLPTLNISYNDAQEEVEKLLLSAFEYRMVSDVPVGIFLSGGYDSTAVAAMLQSQRTNKLKTFTIGFEDGNNEAPFAKKIAHFVGTDHDEYYCTKKEAQEIIPTLPFYYDEPFADSSAIPTMLVSKFARQSVSVALSADAGDEIFAGYNIYKTFVNNLSSINKIPKSIYKPLSNIASILSLLSPNIRYKNRFYILSNIFKTEHKYIPQHLYESYFTISKEIKEKVMRNLYRRQQTSFDTDFSNFKDSLSVALATDYRMYLQNDILTKVDRATMSVSLEGREPFLDHRIIEYVAQLPSNYKYAQTQKMILKDIVHKYVPEYLLDRPKAGFTLPIYEWLKTDLKFLLDEYLTFTIVNNAGVFNPDYVQKLKHDFLKGHFNDPQIIWKLLQFHMWYLKWM